MHVAVVQIIGVIAVLHGWVPAIRAVNVGMILMGCMIHDIFLTFVFNDWPGATGLRREEIDIRWGHQYT
jgi:hypothetical protein